MKRNFKKGKGKTCEHRSGHVLIAWMEMCSVAPLYQLVKEAGTQSMPGKSAPFLTKAEYHSSQSPQWPGPCCRKRPWKGERWLWPLLGRQGVEVAGPIDLWNVSLFHDGIDYVSKSHSLHFWVKLSVPFPYEKKITEGGLMSKILWARAESLEEHNFLSVISNYSNKNKHRKKIMVRLGERESPFGAIY